MARRLSTGSQNTVYPAADLGKHKLVGDSTKRVRVPMPQDLHELKAHADTHFRGHNQGMHHHGKDKLSKHKHMDNVKHGDVVVVSMDRRPQGKGENWMSESQRVFVQHAVEPRTPPVMDKAYVSTPFRGTTTMKDAYRAHEIERRQAYEPPPRVAASRFDGTTTHKSAFVEHKIEPQRPQRQQAPPPSTPFRGATEYKREYVKKENDSPKAWLYLEPELRRSRRSSVASSSAAS